MGLSPDGMMAASYISNNVVGGGLEPLWQQTGAKNAHMDSWLHCVARG